MGRRMLPPGTDMSPASMLDVRYSATPPTAVYSGWVARVPADVSDCAAMEKYRRLPFRTATGAGILHACARITASTQGRTP
jgi:hypothetical protein